MKEKIDWYQEVLELEPGSKVFFPLARLLADSGRFDDAVHTLERGLDRHPEFFEARLYLIDLLYKAGQTDALRPHIDRLTPLLSRYVGFWQAWSTMPPPDSGDGSLALRLLARVFTDGCVDFREVFLRGLASLDSNAPKTSSGTAGSDTPESSPEDADAPDALASDMPDAAAAVQDGVPSDAGDGPLITKFVELAPDASYSELAENAAASDMEDANASVAEAASAFDMEDDSASAMGAEEPSHSSVQTDSHLMEGMSAIDAMDTMSSAPFDAGETAAANAVVADDDGEEERFTLRTRSMAEVLAEQGDYAGALEIYNELVASADTADEMGDLQQRISTLTAHLGSEAGSTGGPAPAEAPDVKDRVISVLEALAERLDSRVH